MIGKPLFRGDRVSGEGEAEVLEVDGGDDGSTRRMCLMPPKYTIKDPWNGMFYVMYSHAAVSDSLQPYGL